MQIRKGNDIGHYRETEVDLLEGMKEALQKQSKSHDMRVVLQFLFGLSVVMYIIVVATKASGAFDLWLLGFVMLFGFGYIEVYINETYMALVGSQLFTRYLLTRRKGRRSNEVW